MFGLQLHPPGEKGPTAPFLQVPRQYYLSARCAFTQVVKTTGAKRVWLPSYLCPSMFDSFNKDAVDVRMYPISVCLRVENDSWIRDVVPNDLVIAIHYFGFELLSFPWRRICDSGAILLEDCCQALYKARTWDRSFGMVFSPRKFLGVPDGEY